MATPGPGRGVGLRESLPAFLLCMVEARAPGEARERNGTQGPGWCQVGFHATEFKANLGSVELRTELRNTEP